MGCDAGTDCESLHPPDDGRVAEHPAIDHDHSLTLIEQTHAVPIDFQETPAVRAPEFPANLDWIHTGNQPLRLSDLRGKIVLLDFWTYG
jgi:hypothetical protein